MPIRCEIVSQDRQVYSGDADIVIVPGADGEMGILPHHAPILSTLKYGLVRVSLQGKEDIFTVAGGIVEVQPDCVTVMADAAENVAEIDEARADAARKRAEEQMRNGPPSDTDSYLAIEAALKRSNLRLSAVRRFRGQRSTFPTSGREHVMALFSKDLGIDLGTMFIRIAEGDKVVLEEPTVAVIDIEEQKLVEVGQRAQDMYGRVPDKLEVIWPLRHGVIADYEITSYLLKAMVRRVGGTFRVFRPRVMVSLPDGVTSVERRGVTEAALEADCGDVTLIWQPQAAALGIDLPIGTPSGNMLLCLGGGCTQAGVLSMFSIVAGESLRIGGAQLDEAIVTYVRKKYGVIIGQVTAEQVKIKIGAAVVQDEERSLEVQGQDQVTGLPRPVSLTTGETVDAMQEQLMQMVGAAKRVLEKTPPELVSDIIDRGVALTGGGALLRGMDKLMTKELGVPAYVVDNPTTCVAEGAVRGLRMRDTLRRYIPPV